MKHKSNLIILAALIGSSIVTAYAGEMSKTVAASNHVKFCADLGQVDVTDKIKVKSSSHVKDFAVCQVAKTNSNSSLNTQSSTGNELSVVAPSGEFMQMTDIFDGSKIYQALGEYSYSGDKVSPGTYATIEMSIGKNYCSQEMYMPIDPEVISYISIDCESTPTAAIMTSKMAAFAPAQSGIRGDAEEGTMTYNE